MSENETTGGKVLLFKRIDKAAPQVATVVSELKALLVIYDRLIALLREANDDELDILTDSLVLSVVRCREAMANGVGEKAGLALLKEMSEGLRQVPGTLRSILPGIGPRLGESIEYKLGIQFSKY